MSIRALLEGEMRQRGWNQSALARHLGVKQQVVSRWMDPEGKMRPSWESCVLIAEKLGMAAADVQRLAGYPVSERTSAAEEDPELDVWMREVREIYKSLERSQWRDLTTGVRVVASLSAPTPKVSGEPTSKGTPTGTRSGEAASTTAEESQTSRVLMYEPDLVLV